MANELQLAKLKEGSEAWNEWRSQHSEGQIIDLYKADISGMKLRGANLRGANLREANFCDTYLTDTNLHGANLRSANLTGAHIKGTFLKDAFLKGADLSGANLYSANFSNANMSGANLSQARLLEAIFANTNLSEAIGLEKVVHDGRSTLDFRTLELSGVLPVNFLRGCGLPDSMIDYLPSMLNQAISFYSCFISYNHADKAFARRLHDQLQGRGIRCWLDDHQVLPGDDIYKQVDQGIKLWDKVLLCASESSLSSWWVDNEIDTTFRKEQHLMEQRGEKVLSLIPLNLDGYIFSDKWENGKASQVKSRLAADFTGWENDNVIFEQAFEKLVKALKTDDAGRETPPESIL